MSEWFEDEGFWTAYAPIMFDEARWAEVPAVVDAIERLVPLPRGASVLDACCGPGRHSLELASRGYRVTGIDITEAYLEAAPGERRWKCPLPSSRPPFFPRGGALRPRHQPVYQFRLFRRSRRRYAGPPQPSRGPQGRRAPSSLETTGKETAARDFTAGESFERGGWGIRTEFSIIGPWEGLRNRWILSRGGEVVDRSFDLRLYSGTELRAALLAAGFAEARIMGSFDGSPYDQSAASLVALAIA